MVEGGSSRKLKLTKKFDYHPSDPSYLQFSISRAKGKQEVLAMNFDFVCGKFSVGTL